MKKFTSAIFVVVTVLQFVWAQTAHAQADIKKIVGQVVRYDAISNAGTANADMIVRLKSGGFMRLLYSPHGYSFDAPPPKAEEILPPEMFSNGEIEWRFDVHAPSNSGQRFRCTSFPNKGVRDARGRLQVETPYDAVPGTGSVVIPRTDSLPCQIISKWSRN